MTVPSVVRCPVSLDDEGQVAYYDLRDVRWEPLEPELALRAIPDLALDAESLVDFMQAHGPLTSLSGGGSMLLPQFGGQGDSATLLAPDLETHAVGTITRIARQSLSPVPIDWVRRHVLALRAVVSHWEAHQAGDEPGIRRAWKDNDFQPPGSLNIAWDWWTDYLNAALAPFTVHVAVEGRRKRGRYDRPITAYSAMVLEIANDVAAGTAWRRCANEPCGKLFARQQGRAEAGQHRTQGIRFCSKSCAKAQTQRALRRRSARQTWETHG